MYFKDFKSSASRGQSRRNCPVPRRTIFFKVFRCNTLADRCARIAKPCRSTGHKDSGLRPHLSQEKKQSEADPFSRFLVLDRNYNARADTGSELFSNALVADELKGVASLRWVDADLNGIIDQNDPVFDHLWVWQDNLRRKEAADEHLNFCERMAA